MRLMLEQDGCASLLINTSSESIEKFDFSVVNGAWLGHYDAGTITVDHTHMKYPGFSVGCTNQIRLAGDYTKVFLNYDDETYDGRTEYQKRCETDPRFADMDDDIPF
jgi:uncharacterized membrane protein YcgQ (UPF0703/DUF1980 family)